MFYSFRSRLTIEGILEAGTALRIGASKSTNPSDPDLPVVKDARDRPYIPGSSFKGVLRSYTEALLRGVMGERAEWACNPTNEAEWCIPSRYGTLERPGIKRLKKKDMNKLEGEDLPEPDYAEAVFKHTCMACGLFGSPWIASPLQIRDLLVDERSWIGQYQERNGVAIDRGREVAADGKLYDFEVVPAGVRFHFKAIAENPEPWQCGMLMAGLRPFLDGDMAIGGARSRGLGVVRLALSRQTYLNADNKKALLDSLIQGGGGEEVNGEKRKEWLESFHQEIRGRLAKER